jgi:hypothetical protein
MLSVHFSLRLVYLTIDTPTATTTEHSAAPLTMVEPFAATATVALLLCFSHPTPGTSAEGVDPGQGGWVTSFYNMAKNAVPSRHYVDREGSHVHD